MNVYDFDGTIYKGDSGVSFVKFIFLKKPFFIIWHLIKTIKYLILYKMKKIEFKNMKEYLFSFVKSLDDIDKLIDEFVKQNKNKIKQYYKNTKKGDDIILSASLDFYLIPLCNAIGISNVICTKYDVKKGKIIGENCRLQEKIKRFEEAYGRDAKIENAYGNSKNDVPMLKMAENRIRC